MLKKLLIPSKENNYYPFLIRRRALATYTLLLFSFNMLFQLFAPELSKGVAATGISSGSITSLTNNERTSAGLTALQYNSRLQNSAYAKGNHMCTHDYWAHNAPDGTTWYSFISAAGYSGSPVGENLAKDFSTAEGVVQAWMGSPTHRANILKAQYTEIGVAVINCTLQGRATTLVVQHFGSRQLSPPPPSGGGSNGGTGGSGSTNSGGSGNNGTNTGTGSSGSTVKPKPLPQIVPEITGITIDEPAFGLNTATSKLTLKGRINIKGSLPEDYTLKILDGETEIASQKSRENWWTFEKSEGYTDGEHSITAYIDGKRETLSATVKFIVDTKPPVLIEDSLEVKYDEEKELWNILFVTQGSDEKEVYLQTQGGRIPGVLSEAGFYTIEVTDNPQLMSGSVALILGDYVGNIAQIDIADRFDKPVAAAAQDSPPTGVTPAAGQIGTSLTPNQIRNYINVGFALFIIGLIMVQVYSYYKLGMLQHRSGYLFTFAIWAIIILVAIVNRINLSGSVI